MPVKIDKIDEITNVAARAENVLQLRSPPAVSYFDGGITAYTIWKNKLLLASGTGLESIDFNRPLGPYSGNNFEAVALPLKIEHSITAIEGDEEDLWIGTEGGGLIRIPQSGGTPQIFDERDGFPMSSITSLKLLHGRLLIGFGYHGSGAFGYLDTATEKFTGMMSKVVEFKSWEERLKPPPSSPVLQIKAEGDNNTFWILSEMALYRLKLDSQQWSLSLPSHDMPIQAGAGLKTLSVFGDFAATAIASGGIAFYKLSENQWTHLNLSTNTDENSAYSLDVDASEKGLLWIGNHGKITVLDMNTSTIIGECKMARPGIIELIFDAQDSIIFLGDDQYSGSYDLYIMNRPKF
jgi:ligand-binding sensor domain-containing protein